MQFKPVFFVWEVFTVLFHQHFFPRHKLFSMYYYLDCMSTFCSVTIKDKYSACLLLKLQHKVLRVNLSWNTNLCLAHPNAETAATTRNVWVFSYYKDGKYAQLADRLGYSLHAECPAIPRLSPATSDIWIFSGLPLKTDCSSSWKWKESIKRKWHYKSRVVYWFNNWQVCQSTIRNKLSNNPSLYISWQRDAFRKWY